MIALLSSLLFVAAAAAEPAYTLHIDAEGAGMHAHGVVWLPASPETVRAILTDYERWPDLFPGRFEVTGIDRRPDRVLTDLTIRRWPLPGTLRLLCETRIAPDGSLLTSLVAGDFQQYRREWILTPEPRGDVDGTRGEVDLRVELSTWMPAWLMITTLRSQMEDHFRALHRRVQSRPAG